MNSDHKFQKASLLAFHIAKNAVSFYRNTPPLGIATPFVWGYKSCSRNMAVAICMKALAIERQSLGEWGFRGIDGGPAFHSLWWLFPLSILLNIPLDNSSVDMPIINQLKIMINLTIVFVFNIFFLPYSICLSNFA